MKLTLERIKEGLRIGRKSDGKTYSVRDDRRRYFFPDEWEAFIKQFKNREHKFFFITMLHTGGRIMEVLNLRYSDINAERSEVEFKTVKQRKARSNFYAVGKSRRFNVASNFIKEYKSFIRGKTFRLNDYIFLDNLKLPENYDLLSNNDKKKHYVSKAIGYSALLKRKISKTNVKDPFNFSPHNIRKTYGMWMRVFKLEMMDLCYRMGHDMDTYMTHYGSSLIFSDSERRKIEKIMGEVR